MQLNSEAAPETIHGKPQFKGKLYGIELEIEAAGLYETDEVFDEEEETYQSVTPTIPAGWLREQEDSIQGVELISAEPSDYMTSIQMINRVFDDIDRQGFTPTRTPRGSTHVHANVCDLTWDQMRHFVVACAWAEPFLIELAGKGRKGNLFAQSYETTPIGWANVIEWCRRKEIAQNTDTHYMATSFYPMSYLGSVEFRMGPSSRSAVEAIQWLSHIDLVVSAGRTLPITGIEEPAFLVDFLKLFNRDKQDILRRKAARQAAEVWYGIIEPYEAPQRRAIRIKKSNVDLLEQTIQAQIQNYQDFLASPLHHPEPSMPAHSLDPHTFYFTHPTSSN